MAFPTVFAQVIQIIPRAEFQSWVTKHNADKGLRTLDTWTWFGAMLFGQLTGHDSIRAIERVFAHSDPKMKALGFGPVRRSTLADANQTRSLAVLEEIFQFCLARATQLAPTKNGFRFKGRILALDSTTIELCLKLSPWARFHHEKTGKGAVKLHTAIDIAGDLPQFTVITNGRCHDVRAARENLRFKPYDTVLIDRAYIDYAWLDELNQGRVTFVTRAKKNLKYKIVECRPTDRTQGHMADQTIYLKSTAGHGYSGTMRRVSYREPDTGRWLVFLTNNFDLSYRTICDLYKARWKVELFFKTLKQNLKVKKFLGTTENAVKSQILIALIAYLLIQILRFGLKTSITIGDAMAVIGILLLLKEPISRILGDLPRVRRHKSSDQLCFEFF